MRFDPDQCASDGEQEILRRADTPIAIPCRDFGQVDPGVGREDDFALHHLACLRISASATAHGTATPGF